MRKLTSSEKLKLLNNRFVLRITPKQVWFTDEFKKIAVNLFLNGQTAEKIFSDHGIDHGIFKISHCKSLINYWHKKLLQAQEVLTQEHATKQNRIEALEHIILIQRDVIEELKRENKAHRNSSIKTNDK